ncbi:MAG: 50S ribosomal protein L25 [Candidatus Hydrogenedentota bacterium]|nr:MAG: 50S ribosomal protein L25 [Candidatus Hydrogenedentota bacterium]
MERMVLEARRRTSRGSRAARRFRRQGLVPSVLYGHGDPEPLLLDAKEVERLLGKSAGETPLVDVKVEDRAPETALVRDVQHHPVSRKVQHVDLLRVEMTEKLDTTLPVLLEGESPAVKLGGILMHMNEEIEVRALPKDLPDAIRLDLGRLEKIGDAIHVSDLEIPDGVEVITPGRITIVTVQAPSVAEKEEGKAEGEEEKPTAAEPEVIGKEEEGSSS